MIINLFLISVVSSIEIHLTNLQQVYYSVPIEANNKRYNLIVDTGSQILWINGKNTQRRNYYECDNCTALREISIEYGIGHVYGKQYTSLFNLANHSLTLNVLAADKIESLNDLLADGLIGFGKPDNKSQDHTLQRLFDEKIIDSRQFGLLLNDENCQSTSILTLGEPNKTHFYGELYYVNSTQSDLWHFYGGSIEIAGNNKKEKLESQKQYILLDSGTSKILLSKYKFEKLHNILNDDFNMDCEISQHNSFNVLVCQYSDFYPQFIINIGNLSLNLQSQDYVQYCYHNFLLQHKCYLNFQNVDSTDELILGVTFLQKYYTHYDIDNNRIGIATSMSYTKDKLELNQLGTQYNYNMLLLSLLVTTVLLIAIYIVVKLLLRKSIPLYLSVLEKSSSRSQEQEMEAITLKTQPNQPTL